jgi:acetoin utilization deacetylase AcuC-like enzyme
MGGTGIVRSELFLEHNPGAWHPESPHRLEYLHAFLDNHHMPGLVLVPPRPATQEEISLIHRTSHFERIAQTAQQAQCYLDADTQTCARSFEAALCAAGGLITLVEKVLDGELDNGFAMVRPPGHHAESNQAMGFCLFNNIAIAAAWALEKRGLSRILIVDWDLHHGNGTQNAFYADPRVLYISTHLFPFYPGSGSLSEYGQDKGKGFTINIPMPSRRTDKDYVAIFQKVVRPVAYEFRPELILVSAGFDTHMADPMQGMSLTSEGFAAMTYILKKAADDLCQSRLVLTLEGGYDYEAQTRSVAKVLDVLTGTTDAGKELALSDLPEPEIVPKVRKVHKNFWNF